MCSAYDDPTQYDDPIVRKPTRIVVAGDIEVRPFPPFPYDWEMAATAGREEPVKPTLRQRIRSAFRWTW